jgi:hypothetical protein
MPVFTVNRLKRLKKIGIALAGMALALGGTAESQEAIAGKIQPLPAGFAWSLGPSAPNDTVYFNVIHAYAPADSRRVISMTLCPRSSARGPTP